MVMRDIFITLFFLGASLDIYIAYPQQVEISKHRNNGRKKIKDRNRKRVIYTS